MKTTRARVPIILCIAMAAALVTFAADDPAEGAFEASVQVTGPQGTRSLKVTIDVTSVMSREDAGHYRQLLKEGGQQALLRALQDARCGRLFIGSMETSLGLVFAERDDDDWSYVVVAPRNMALQGDSDRASPNYPFTIARFEVPGMGRGDGELVPHAALGVEDDGRLIVERREGVMGRLKEVKRLR